VELIGRAVAAGMVRLFTSPASLLFLLVLALAARSGREAMLLLPIFLAGEWLALPAAPRIPIPLAPGFLAAAMVLTSVYLAAESAFLPEGRLRWLIVVFWA